MSTTETYSLESKHYVDTLILHGKKKVELSGKYYGANILKFRHAGTFQMFMEKHTMKKKTKLLFQNIFAFYFSASSKYHDL